MFKKVFIILITVLLISCSRSNVSINDVLEYMDKYFEAVMFT